RPGRGPGAVLDPDPRAEPGFPRGRPVQSRLPGLAHHQPVRPRAPHLAAERPGPGSLTRLVLARSRPAYRDARPGAARVSRLRLAGGRRALRSLPTGARDRRRDGDDGGSTPGWTDRGRAGADRA